MENIISNVKHGAQMSDRLESGFDLARLLADEHEQKTGRQTRVRRIIDYIDTYNGRQREHYSFDVFEIF